MEISFSHKKKTGKVKLGQVRYNNEGFYVLIVKSHSKLEHFDAIVLSKNNYVQMYDWNTKDGTGEKIESVYPYVAEAKLEINH